MSLINLYNDISTFYKDYPFHTRFPDSSPTSTLPYAVTNGFIQNKLRYDKDLRGGGYSGLPFIQFRPPGMGATPDEIEYYERARTSPDFPLRGGASLTDDTGFIVPEAAKYDYTRIKRFLETPKGKIFIRKQIGLQLSNPNIQTGGAINVTGIGSTSFFPLLGNNRVYNGGLNTLAQVRVQGSGIHLDRAGAIPAPPRTVYYSEIVPYQPKEDNRLVLLYETKLAGLSAGRTGVLNSLGIPRETGVILRYLGGPESVYGVGLTTIRRYTNTGNLTNNVTQEAFSGTEIGTVSPINFNYAYNYKQLQNAKPAGANTTQFHDFRKELGIDYSNYEEYNIEKRLGFDSPGKRDYRGLKRTFYDANVKDRLLSQRPYTFKDDPWTETDKFHEDIIKFGFEAINNDTPGLDTAVLFRAFLSDINDNNSAAYNTFRYLGRGEEFFVYQGVSRSATFSFKVAAQSRYDMQMMYQKTAWLVSQTYPDYSTSGMMRAPLIRLTIGDYFYRVPGILETVNILVDNDTPWEIGLSERPSPENTLAIDTEQYKYNGVHQLPHVLTITCTFRPIYSKLPQRAKYEFDSRTTGNFPQMPLIGREEFVQNKPVLINGMEREGTLEDRETRERQEQDRIILDRYMRTYDEDKRRELQRTG